MANFRIVMDNAADRASVSASSTAGSLVAANMLTNDPELVWRATGKSATLTLTWSTAETISAVVIGWTNLTSQASVTVRAFTNTGDSTPVAQVTASPGSAIATLRSDVQAWLQSPVSARKVEIVISDATNSANVEAGRIVAGTHHETEYNPGYGASIAFVDKSIVTRTESGGVRRDPATIHRVLSVQFNYMKNSDALAFMSLASMGVGALVFVSLFPGAYHDFHHTHAFLGCVIDDMSQSLSLSRRSDMTLRFEEIV